ncbi:hypothetical protein PTNB85_04365 [Pyrenophora teres f. teres]|nr:hypothetical protein PTNB85_04365 [Pyrenophora teres f. teres]KAE8848896.1 hypothetical protein HRS9122_02912 [Pyrenophora teres f. teres]
MKTTLFAAAAFLATCISAAPANNAQQNKANCEDKYGPLPCGSVSSQTYSVVSGDTLTILAGRFQTGICDISRYNNISDDKINNLSIGQQLIIPTVCAAGKGDNTTCVKDAVKATGTADCVNGLSVNPPQYVVIPDDTTLKIANKFNLVLSALEAPNKAPGRNFDVIKANDTFIVPVCQGCSCTNDKHTIKSGDTFSDLATKAGVLLGQILAANPKQIPEQLQIGQVVNVPKCQCAK